MLLATKPILPYKVMLEAERDLIKEESSRTPGGFRSGPLELWLLEHFIISCLSMVLALGEKDQNIKAQSSPLKIVALILTAEIITHIECLLVELWF